ncbi:phage filamentation protein Fil family protein, partial [Dickeya lacustris]
MISIARVFISQPPIIPNQGKGWLELPNGQRVKPSVSQVYFAPWSQKPYMPE